MKKMDKKTAKIISEKVRLILAVVALFFVAYVVAKGFGADFSGPASEIFSKVPLKARAAFVYDAGSGKMIYGTDYSEKLPLASVTKIMTVMTAQKILPEDYIIPLRLYSTTTEADRELVDGEKWKLKDLAGYTLVGSSNSGAYSIALATGNYLLGNSSDPVASRKAFVKEMNLNAKKMGLPGLSFSNETGFDVDDSLNGGMGSAKDVALMLWEFSKKYPDEAALTAKSSAYFQSAEGKVYSVSNTNILASQIPILLASKTGYTALSGGNLAIIFETKGGRKIIISILGSTAEGRFTDLSALVAATAEYFSLQK